MKKILAFLTLLFAVSTNAFATSTSTCFDTDTVLMLHMNGTDASTTFTDSSNASNTVTAQGNAQIDTAQSKFSGASGLFDGSGDYLTVPDSNNFNLSTGNFTLDFWVRFNVLGAENGIFGISNTASGQDTSNVFDFRIDGGSSTSIQFLVKSGGSTLINVSAAHGMSTGVWYHVALIRGWGGNANDWAITVNGSSITTFTNTSTLPDFTNVVRIGDSPFAGNQSHDGWLDELRLVKGTAVWTANFTSPSAEYTACATRRRVLATTVSA